MRCRLASVLLGLTVLTAADAWADGDAEGAKKHFAAGKKLRDDGDCTKAIDEFEASLAADKSIGAYYNLGFCREQLGSRQEAYEAYKKARDMASVKNDDRLKEISGALAALLETPNIRLILPNPLPSDIQVFVDGDLVPSALYQTELIYFTKTRPVHDVKVTAPGYQDLNTRVDARELKAIELRAPDAPGPSAPPEKLKPPPEDTTRARNQHLIGGAAAIVGGIAADTVGIIVIATYATQRARLKRHVDTAAANGDCRTTKGSLTCGTPAQKDAYNTAVSNYDDRGDAWNSVGWLAIAGTVVGTLAVAGGVYLLFTAPPAEPAASASLKPVILPTLSPTFQGLSLSGTF